MLCIGLPESFACRQANFTLPLLPSNRRFADPASHRALTDAPLAENAEKGFEEVWAQAKQLRETPGLGVVVDSRHKVHGCRSGIGRVFRHLPGFQQWVWLKMKPSGIAWLKMDGQATGLEEFLPFTRETRRFPGLDGWFIHSVSQGNSSIFPKGHLCAWHWRGSIQDTKCMGVGQS